MELEAKVGSHKEHSMLATDIIIKNHRKLCDTEKETFDKMVDDVKANGGHIVPRLQEPSSEKIGTDGLVKKLVNDVKATGNHIVPRYAALDFGPLDFGTKLFQEVIFGNTKNKVPNIKILPGNGCQPGQNANPACQPNPAWRCHQQSEDSRLQKGEF